MVFEIIINLVAKSLVKRIATTNYSGDRLKIVGFKLSVNESFKESWHTYDEVWLVFLDNIGELFVRKGRNQDTAHTFTEWSVDTNTEAKTVEEWQNGKNSRTRDDLANHSAITDGLGVDIEV